MDLAQLIRLAITAGILLLVFALGLRATPEDMTYLFRHPSRFLRGFLAMGVIVPASAAALAALFDLARPVEIALLAMAVSPLPPILPGKQLKLGGRSRYVFGLLVAASLVAVAFVPLAIEVLGWLFRREAHVGAGAVARVVCITVLLPLAAGLTVHRVAPMVAERIAPGLLASATCCRLPASWRSWSPPGRPSSRSSATEPSSSSPRWSRRGSWRDTGWAGRIPTIGRRSPSRRRCAIRGSP